MLFSLYSIYVIIGKFQPLKRNDFFLEYGMFWYYKYSLLLKVHFSRQLFIQYLYLRPNQFSIMISILHLSI